MYVGTSSGGTKEVQFVGESSGSLINGNISLGSIVTLWYNDMLWRIVHIDEGNNEIVLAKLFVDYDIMFNSQYGKVSYSSSNILSECNAFLNTLPQIVQDNIISKTVHGVTKKVWIPQVNWISNNQPDSASGTNNEWVLFDYFVDGGTKLNVTNIHGGIVNWWTASAYNSDSVVWTVRNGFFAFDGPPTTNIYFRPFICLPLS